VTCVRTAIFAVQQQHILVLHIMAVCL